jgi:hypothetical protein
MAYNLKSKMYLKEVARVFEHSDLNVRVARLAVLYEDLRIEMFAIAAPELPALDFTDERYRRLYFVRRAVATFVEFKGALTRLDQCPGFCDLKKTFSTDELQQWHEAVSFFETHKDTFKTARDDIGGHFQEKAAESALRDIKKEAVAKIEIVKGPNGGAGVRLLFAGELAATALTVHRGNKTTQEFIDFLIRLIRDGFERAVAAAHVIYHRYLLPRFAS